MICIDTKNGEAQFHTGPGKGKTAHLMSDLPGEEGTKELLQFGKQIGLHPQWIQHKGEPKEHFDVWASKIDAALENGAKEVGLKGTVEIMQKKREAYG